MIDIIIVVSYLFLLLSVGIYNRAKKGNFKNFATISDKGVTNNKLLLVGTIFVSSIGGGAAFGISEKTFSGSIAYTYALFMVIPIDLFIAKYIIPRLVKKHYGTQTIGDIMFYYYGAAGRTLGGFASLVVCIGLVAAQISVSGRIFQYILQLDYIEGVMISYGVVIIYTTIGGLRSVLFTNQIQFLTILITIPIISVVGIYQIGFEIFTSNIPSEGVILVENPKLIQSTLMAFLGFSVMNLFPTFIQRALINQDTEKTKKAIYIKSVIYAIFLIFITINGLLAYMLYPDVSACLALPYLIDHIIPVGLQGLVVSGFLASVMSTADSDLNVTSITIVKDFLKPIFKLSNEHNMLIFARFANIIIGSLSIFMALCFNNIVDLVIFISGFWGPIILIPLVFGLYDITISKIGMILSSFLGMISFIAWECFTVDSSTNLKGVFVGTMVNLSIFMIFWLKMKSSKNAI